MDSASAKTLVKGNLLLSTSSFSSVVMADVFDSLLCSQLYAELEASKFDAPIGWFSRYDDAIQRIAKWGLFDHERDNFEPGNNAEITVAALIDTFLMSRLPVTQRQELKNMVDCVGGLAQTDAVSILLRQNLVKPADNAAGHSSIFFQVSALVPTAQLFSLSVAFKTTSEVGSDPLRQAFPGSTIVGEVDVRFASRGWDYASYQGVRERVERALAGKKAGQILPILCKVPDGDDDGK